MKAPAFWGQASEIGIKDLRVEGRTGEVLNIDPGLLFNEHTFDWETVEVRSSLDG